MRISLSMFIIVFFFFLLGEVFAASPKCKLPNSLEKLIKDLEPHIRDLQGQYKEKCLEMEFAEDKISAGDYSQRFRKFFVLSAKNRVIDQYFSAFPPIFPDALSHYYELVPKVDELWRKAGNHDYQICLATLPGESESSGRELRKVFKEIEELFAYHENVVANVIPASIEPLKASKAIFYPSEKLRGLVKSMSKELSLRNQRVCKDQETEADGGLISVDKASGKTMKSQDKADRKAGGGGMDTPPPAPEMSKEFKKGLSLSNATASGDDFPAFFSLNTEEIPEADEPKTFFDDPIAWLWGKLKLFENKESSTQNVEFFDNRELETNFRVRHEKWRNDRNFIINRVKDIAGVRTDGFSKKLDYTFDIVQGINKLLVETLRYKDIVCVNQAVMVVCPK